VALAALMAGAAVASEQTPSAAPAATDPTTVSGVTVTGATPVVAPEDPIVCRKAPETGSRVRAMKECRKKSEWAAKSKSRGHRVDGVRFQDCGGGGAACDPTPRPPGG